MPQVRVHDLKRTFGRRLRAKGVSHETRQVLLGHKNGQITTHYSAAEIGELIDAVEKVSWSGSSAPTLTLINNENSRNGNVVTFPNISEARKVLKNKEELVATGGLEPPTPAL